MKKLFLLGLTINVLAFSACSKNDDQVKATPTPANTPDAARLKSESERLQQATANAAEQRKRDESSPAQPATGRSPKADLSPQTVPPQSANPTP
jgi:hypothetical protein